MNELRDAPRRRTRLRPVKVVTLADRFLEDASARDLSRGGVRLVRFREDELPRRLKLVDPAERTERVAVLVWARGGEAGFRFVGEPRPVPEKRLRALTGDFYGV